MKRAAFVLLGFVLLAQCVRAQPTREQVKGTSAYLIKLKRDDGGFAPAAGVEKSSLRATSSCLRAMRYFGFELPLEDKAKCEKFVASCFDKGSGGFADAPGGKPDVTTTAVGLMAVVELKMPREPYEAPAVKYLGDNAKTFDEIRIAVAGLEAVAKKSPQAAAWTETVLKMANDDATFGKGDGQARDTGGATVALLRLGAKLDKKDAVLKALNAGQRKDGGFGKADAKTSDLESSYRVARCYHMLKEKPDAAKLAAFVASCRNDDGGYGVAPGEKSSASGAYYAAIITHWLAEK
jgi:prenyltransferase beta subunit